jgi:nucleotide-binding universal stress UspA family protein
MSNQQTIHPYVVVVAIDFSDPAADALREAVELASHAPRAELHVVHVYAVPSPPAQLGAMVVPEFVYHEQIEGIRHRLAEWLEPYRSTSVRLTGHIRLGAPAEEIVQLASDVAANLIVTGSHSHRGLERILLGSVAEHVVRSAPCAVLVYRARAAQASDSIEPPCPACLETQRKSARAQLWCQRHSEHHVRAHTYYEYPSAYGIGSQSFRFEP